ncbi:hypothetical protein D3C59_37115 [Streptomyces sp. SHP22-7]|nr:hypothetical protein D3C59_37115 [Streptomyces sp. SHP22-7]
MPKLHTTPGKAIAQIERRDADKANQYRAELRVLPREGPRHPRFTTPTPSWTRSTPFPARRKLDILNQGTLDLLRGQ